SGRVVEVFVERGAKVEAGAPLIRLRDVDYKLQAQAAKAQLEQARARLGVREGGDLPRAESTPDVATARAELALAKSELENAEALAKSGALSSRELEQLRTQASAAKERYQSALNGAKAQIAAVAAAKTTLEQAKTAADEAVVRAPFAGEIADRLVSVGEYVSPQIPLVKLVRVHPLRIELSVPQQHLQDVQPGQRVTLVVDAIPGRKFDATVRYVSAAVERNTRSLTVEAVVPNDDGVLRPGLFATARLQTGAAQRVVEVPVAAVRTAAGVSRVYVVRDGVITERVLSIVERGQSTVTVAEGLDGDEQVAIDAFDQLGDGVAVNVLPAD
ncbi:MAG: efflux RND transporter periplasmic adaptor subunit, partial [Myxococcales bacterium]|nr:efflux RND transporter periplasmic adaptor subunit [Myxococcales bacterium]